MKNLEMGFREVLMRVRGAFGVTVHLDGFHWAPRKFDDISGRFRGP